MSRDRRLIPRIDLENDLPGSITVIEPMRVAQLSLTGAEIVTTVALQVGTLHDLRVTLGDHIVVVKGRIVHASVRHLHREHVFYRTGVEFINLTETAADTIGDFIHDLPSRRGADPATDPDAGT